MNVPQSVTGSEIKLKDLCIFTHLYIIINIISDIISTKNVLEFKRVVVKITEDFKKWVSMGHSVGGFWMLEEFEKDVVGIFGVCGRSL